jgi:hypothetical protein
MTVFVERISNKPVFRSAGAFTQEVKVKNVKKNTTERYNFCYLATATKTTK